MLHLQKLQKKKLFDLPKHHPKLGKVKEYEKSNSKNAKNTKCQILKPVKNDRSGLLVLNLKVGRNLDALLSNHAFLSGNGFLKLRNTQ